jgi:predicted DNA-binding transcriptional regulator YafY
MSNALIRYRIINNMLKGGRIVSLDEILDACYEYFGYDISERTIREDIKEMRFNRMIGWNAPIENIRSRKYRYADPDYSIDKLKLTDEEAESLMFVGRLLDQYSDMVPFNQIPGAIQKVFNHVKIRKELLQEEFGDFIDFEKAPETPGLEYMVRMIEHIRKQHVLKVRYRSFANADAPEKELFPFHPYYLKEYRNRWYVLGYNAYWGRLSLYGLDRIQGLERMADEEYIPSKIPPGDYFRNVIGVTKFNDSKPQKVLIRVSQQQAPYVLSQPIHESQKLVEEHADHIIISLEVHDSPELQILLHGWHTEVEVLEPLEMRAQFRERVKKILEKYQTK